LYVSKLKHLLSNKVWVGMKCSIQVTLCSIDSHGQLSSVGRMGPQDGCVTMVTMSAYSVFKSKKTSQGWGLGPRRED